MKLWREAAENIHNKRGGGGCKKRRKNGALASAVVGALCAPSIHCISQGNRPAFPLHPLFSPRDVLLPTSLPCSFLSIPYLGQRTMEESRAKQGVGATKREDVLASFFSFVSLFPCFVLFCAVSGRLRSLLLPSLLPPSPCPHRHLSSPAVPSFPLMPGRNGEIKGISRTRSPQ